jgi:tetratricopeptide (TPR) repeat protein
MVSISGTWPISAKELWERPWIEVRTPHFVFVSALPEARTIALARDLENFRSAVVIVTNIQRVEARIPTTVYVLPYAVEELGFKNHITGYFAPRMRANYAAVIPATNALDDAVKHEYVHFLVHNRDSLAYPHWFDEGFAEVLETVTVTGNVLEFGQPDRVRAEWLRNSQWMSFAKILETRDVLALHGSDQAMYYAQSWLLVHFLINGRPDRKFAFDNGVFLKLVESGTPPTPAFEQAFGLSISELNTALHNYAPKLRYMRVTLADVFPQTDVQTTPVTPDSVAAQLGTVFVLRGQPKEAKRVWEAAIALNPANCTALIGLGDLLKGAEKFEEAQPYYEKAIALEPDNAYHELDYAEYFLDRAYAGIISVDVDNDLIEARRHFARSYAIDKTIPETLAMNGASYLFSNDTVPRAVESLEAAHDMLPSETQISMLLAQAYTKSGNRAAAGQLLRRVSTWSYGNSRAADELLRQLEAEDAAGVEPPPTEAQ